MIINPYIFGGNYIGLLDTYTGAAAAYSLRKLRSAYTGYAVRVRRSSDNTTQDIGFNSNGTLDTATLSTFVGANSGYVSIWYDQSGNNNNANQVTSAAQPIIYNAGSLVTVNSKPSLYLSGSNNLALTSTITLNSFTNFWVSKKKVISDGYYILLSQTNSGGNYFAEPNTGGSPQVATSVAIISTTLSNSSASTIVNTQHLSYANRRNTNQAVGQLNNSSNSYNNSVNSSALPINFIANYGVYSYDGNVQEIIIYGSDKSSDRTAISSNINSFYSIY